MGYQGCTEAREPGAIPAGFAPLILCRPLGLITITCPSTSVGYFCSTDSAFSFMREIQVLSTSDKLMIFYDIEGLFTNIPALKKSIELALQYIINGNPTLKLAQNELKLTFFIATSQMHFIFSKDSFYDQIDGVAILPNLFMGRPFYFTVVMLMTRFAYLTRRLMLIVFKIVINSRHPNNKLTMKKNYRKLAFLDVLIDNSSSIFCYHNSFSQKNVLTGFLTNFFSLTSFSYTQSRPSVIRTLVDRTFKINNTWNTWTDFTRMFQNLVHTKEKYISISFNLKHYQQSVMLRKRLALP